MLGGAADPEAQAQDALLPFRQAGQRLGHGLRQRTGPASCATPKRAFS
jgi:hypothetical protein